LVDLTAGLDANCPAEELFAWVEDLGRYPKWLEIVPRAVPEDGEPGTWTVDLRGRLGPLARSKRLRMVRTLHQPPERVVFERQERDGRSHAPWVLTAEVEPTPTGSRLAMTLHYGGGLWAPLLERMLRDEITRSRARLLAQLSG
jgi:hypothetical protein